MRFELTRLRSYGSDEVLAEIRRVAAEVPGRLTEKAFREHARVSLNTVRRRFGTWEEALQRAELGDRYVGPALHDKSVLQLGRRMTRRDVIEEIRRVAGEVAPRPLTAIEFRQRSSCGLETVRSRLGPWPKALRLAGMVSSTHGRRYTDDECLRNLRRVWSHYDRPPKYREMGMPPSAIGGKAYVLRWGSWADALAAFVEFQRTE
jgi:hypothetical protein